LFGFLQAFHWAVVSGLPLFILSHPTGTANALCSVFDCGFPVISSELVATRGFHRFAPTPKDKEYRTLLSHPNKPFKVVCFRSHMQTHPCLRDAFVPSADAACAAAGGSRKTSAHAAVCWHVAALQALMPRLSRGALLRLPVLMRTQTHGDVARIMALAQAEGVGLRGGGLARPVAMLGATMPALHVRTLSPNLETYASIKGSAAANFFRANLELLVAKTDFCTFLTSSNGSSNSDSPVSSGRCGSALGWSGRDVFVASDSLALKELLALRWEPLGWRLHFFTTTGARLTSVPRPAHGFHPAFAAANDPAPVRDQTLGRGGAHMWLSTVGGDAAQFGTLLELWLLSRAAPLVAMTFFDVRLATAAATQALQQQPWPPPHTPRLLGHPSAVEASAVPEVAAADSASTSSSSSSSSGSGSSSSSSSSSGIGSVSSSSSGSSSSRSSSPSAPSQVAHELRALSTFAKAAALRGGLAAAAALSQCHGIGAGRAPARVARPGPGACSSECQGLETVYSP
jgi:uncharacterized membrane protein YgcG